MINYLFDLVCLCYFKILYWLKCQEWNWFTGLFIGMPLLVITTIVFTPLIAVLVVVLKILKPLVGIKEYKITKYNDDIAELIHCITYGDYYDYDEDENEDEEEDEDEEDDE